MSSACYEIILLHGVLLELGYSQTQLTMLHVDRQVQYKLHQVMYHERKTHIDVNFHSIREAYDCRATNLPHVSTSTQLTDIFIKVMTRRHQNFLNQQIDVCRLTILNLRRDANKI